ncbi:GNAT family N-acetyltransferase [Bosea eneae]|uniref:GNAT family N-acetyltransferase n=1 Tax=Bosea eneae TaxID=151454 RepID=A0ABW0INI5_9HYPH
MLPVLESERLLLRPRTEADLDAIAAMNADPLVMRYIRPLGDPSMSREGVKARSFLNVDRGLGYWSVFARDDESELLGYVGLIPWPIEEGAVELSYRFAARHWKQGYALEAGARLVRHGFAGLALPQIAIVTHPDNAAALRLAERLGFRRESDRLDGLIGDPPVPGACFRHSAQAWRAADQAAIGLNAR